MDVELLYDPDRVRQLMVRTQHAIDFLDNANSDEPAAASAIAELRTISFQLSTTWMPVLAAIVGDRSLLDWSTGLDWSAEGPEPTGAVGLATFPAVLLRGLAPTTGGDELSDVDLALGVIAGHFADLDRDGDGELSWAELEEGRTNDDAEVAAACALLTSSPLAFANSALALEDYSVGELGDVATGNLDDGGWEYPDDVDAAEPWQFLTLTPAAIQSALEQNRHLRTLAQPAVYAAADGADDDGEIDGQVSMDGIEALSEHSDDPEVLAMCAFYIAGPNAFRRIERESPEDGYDSTIRYDQVFELGTNQGALAGLPDPTIPAGLQAMYGDPIDYGGADPQFLHYPIEPQPGAGQVVIALYIPTPTAGATVAEGTPLEDYLVSTGDNRGPDANAHPSDSRTWVVVDYESGIVTVRVNPSSGMGGAPDDTHDALPLTTSNDSLPDAVPVVQLPGPTPGMLDTAVLTAAGVDRSNVANVSADGATIHLDLDLVNSDKVILAPELNAAFAIELQPGGTVRVDWVRDNFPAMEAYHVYPDGSVETIAQDDAEWAAFGGLLGPEELGLPGDILDIFVDFPNSEGSGQG